jgi:hypothetical protein
MSIPSIKLEWTACKKRNKVYLDICHQIPLRERYILFIWLHLLLFLDEHHTTRTIYNYSIRSIFSILYDICCWICRQTPQYIVSQRRPIKDNEQNVIIKGSLCGYTLCEDCNNMECIHSVHSWDIRLTNNQYPNSPQPNYMRKGSLIKTIKKSGIFINAFRHGFMKYYDEQHDAWNNLYEGDPSINRIQKKLKVNNVNQNQRLKDILSKKKTNKI